MSFTNEDIKKLVENTQKKKNIPDEDSEELRMFSTMLLDTIKHYVGVVTTIYNDNPDQAIILMATIESSLILTLTKDVDVALDFYKKLNKQVLENIKNLDKGLIDQD